MLALGRAPLRAGETRVVGRAGCVPRRGLARPHVQRQRAAGRQAPQLQVRARPPRPAGRGSRARRGAECLSPRGDRSVVDAGRRIAAEEGVAPRPPPSTPLRQPREQSPPCTQRLTLLPRCPSIAPPSPPPQQQQQQPPPGPTRGARAQVAAFWRGSMPFVNRAMLVGACQVPCARAPGPTEQTRLPSA